MQESNPGFSLQKSYFDSFYVNKKNFSTNLSKCVEITVQTPFVLWIKGVCWLLPVEKPVDNVDNSPLKTTGFPPVFIAYVNHSLSVGFRRFSLVFDIQVSISAIM